MKSDAQVSVLLNPSSYGYTFSSAAGTYTTLSGGTVFQTGATLNTDANSAAITLPFTFTYNGIKENTIFINNNGYITLGPTAVSPASTTVPLSTSTAGVGGYDGCIAGLANNLAASTAAGAVPEIRYGTNGAGDFVVQFQDVGISASAGTRATFQIVLRVDGKTVSIIYGPNNTGISGASGSQVGMRGTCDEDWNNRALSSGGNWNTSGGAAGTANTNTMTWTATSTLPASGLTFTWSPRAYTPTYLANPVGVCQEFTTWTNGAGPNNVPSANWATNGYGNASWQIDNTTATTTSSGWTSTSGAYSPVDYASASGGRSARFHSFQANSPQVGYLDYYVDMSTAAGTTNLDFYQINPSGTDILQVFLSTNGGSTFTQLGTNIGTAATWTLRSLSFTSTSATTIIRFKATADFGNDDIGIDHVCLAAPPACTVPTSLAAGSITASSASITWTCSGCTGTYELDYGPNPHTAGTGTIITGVTSPSTLNPPLTSNTGYQVFVRQNCGVNGFSSWSSGVTFTTSRVCPGDLGANSVTVGSLPYSTTGQTTCGSGNNITSTNVAVVCGSANYYGAEDRTYIFTPTTTGTHTILLTTATDDDAGIMLYQGCPYTAGSTCVANAQSTSGLTRTLTPTLTSGVTYYLVVDNFPAPACIGTYSLNIDPPAACPTPTALAAGSVTATTASISWTCTGCTGTFELDYGPNPHTAGTGTIITGVTSPYTLDPPLTSNTGYQVFLRQDCGVNGFSTWSTGATFTTLPTCPGGLGVNSVTVSSLPYSTTGQTTCGSGNNVTSTNVVSVCGSTSYYGAEDRTYIFTPSTSGVHNILLTTATDDDAGIMLYQGCPFTAGSTCVANAQSTSGLTRTLSPTLTSGVTYYLVVDNFPAPACIGTYSLTIDPPVACPTPTAVAAGSITQSSASITWTCTGCTGTFELDYGPNPHTAGTGTIMTGVTSPYTLNPPLSASTGYQVFVRQDCSGGGNGFSAWSTGATFTTLAPPPANDDCSGAVLIPTAGPFPYTTAAVSIASATDGSDPITTCQSNSHKGIWYAFTPDISGSYTISSCQSAAAGSTVSDNILGIYTSAASCAGPFTQVACDDDGCTTLSLQATITTTLTCGATYYIVASGYDTNVGDIQLNITAPSCSVTAYNVTGGGGYCAGGAGVAVGTSGSDLCFNYELFRDGSPVSTLAGTGSALSFGLQTVAGTYTVVATHSVHGTCTGSMSGSAVITVNPLPTITCGSNMTGVCSNSTPFTLAGNGESPSGGTFSGPGVSSGIFNPTTAGAGVHMITYSYTDGNGCTNTPCTFTITVTAAVDLYTDADNDGFGDFAAAPIQGCPPLAGYSTNNTDECDNDPLKTETGECGCGVAETDTDGDGAKDCVDGCPNDINKTNPGACGCGVPDLDTDGDSSMDCVDGCPNDPLKTAPGICGCGVADADADGDGALNCEDACPNDPNKIASPGTCGCGNPEPGAACDDGNVNTINDVITAGCTCAGTPVDPIYELQITTDANGGETSWDITPYPSGGAVCSGSGYAPSSTQTLTCQLPNGCYVLNVYDSGGDGMCCISGTGGFVLRTAGGERIIDAAQSGIFMSQSTVALGFCVPISADKLTPSRCDRVDYQLSEFVQAIPNAAVQATYNPTFPSTQTDDGYTFWFFNPNGGYSRRITITHAYNNYWFPSGPDRCSYLKLTSIVTSPLPINTLLNVRVRSLVNGVYGEFGPACRFKIDTELNCPTTQLINDVNNTRHSCGLTGVLLNGSRTLYAVPVSAANKYQFEFTKPGYLRKISMPTSSLNLTPWYTLPLQYNSTYNVRVRVSFDNGVTFCPFGAVCTMQTAAAPPAMGGGGRDMEVDVTEASTLRLWPNPNSDGLVRLSLNGLGEGSHDVSIDIYSLTGARLQGERLNLDGEEINHVINLVPGMERGMYLVNIRLDGQVRTERLVVQ